MHGVACGAANGFSSLHPTQALKPTYNLYGAKLVQNAPRTSVLAGVATPNNLWTAESCSGAKAPRFTTSDSSSSNVFSANEPNDVVWTARSARTSAKTVDAGSDGRIRTSRLLDADDAHDHIHRAPAGIADRIAAASQRYASRQQRQHQPGTKVHQSSPHDPVSCRFWEARLLSRACQSLAFHISSHFHVPMGPTDPLAAVLSFTSNSNSNPLAALAPPSTSSTSPLGLGASQAPDAAGTSAMGDIDPYGMYDNLPAVYALKAVATALVDPALWRSSPPGSPGAADGPAPATTSPPAHASAAAPHPTHDQHERHHNRAAAGVASLSPERHGTHQDQHHQNHQNHQQHQQVVQLGQHQHHYPHQHQHQQSKPSSPGCFPRPDPQQEQSPHAEAPPAMNALARVAAGVLLRLAHSCGHPGCYSLAGTAPPLPSTSAFASVSAAVPNSSDLDGAHVSRLPGVPFTGRQLVRLYDMAASADGIDAGALAGVPASTVAALLVLLAAAQPQPHPAVAAASRADQSVLGSGKGLAGPTAGGVGAGTIPAALLARYLRVGSRGHNPLDTVRVMWALLRLQLPGAGPLLLPLEPGGTSSGNSSGSSSGSDDDEEAALRRGGVAAAGVGVGELMTQLSYVLARQLRNRDRALAALRAARPGEVYGTWQLAVQALALMKERLLAQERSAAALAQLDSALELLEATLSEAVKGSPEVAAPAAPSAKETSGSSRPADGEAPAALTNSAIEALQAFLEMSREVAAARDAAPSFSLAGSAPAPAWDVVPRSDAEWRAVLGDTEQRVALLFSTWPELGRLVAGGSPSPSHGSALSSPSLVNAAFWHGLSAASGSAGSGSGGSVGIGSGVSSAPPAGAASAAFPSHQQNVGGSSGAAAALAQPAGSQWSATEGSCGAAAAAAGDVGGADASTESASAPMWTQRRLQIQLKPYSDLHLRTLELLYRALKAQAPDARLYASLTPGDADAEAEPGPQAGSTGNADASALQGAVRPSYGASNGGAGGGIGHSSASRRLLRAVALPHVAPVDMVYTDARGRRVGLCLAHLGASRRAPGELAVLQNAVYGWPEAEVEAVQQGFRAARSAAKAAAAAAAAHAQAQAARAAAAKAAAMAPAAASTKVVTVHQCVGTRGGGGGGGPTVADVQAALAAAAVASATVGLMRSVAAVVRSSSADATAAAMPAAAVSTGPPTQPVQAENANAGVKRQQTEAHQVAATPATTARGSPSNTGEEGDAGLEDCGLDAEEQARLEAAAAAIESDAAAVAAAPDVAAVAVAKAAAAVTAAVESPFGWGPERDGTAAAVADHAILGLDDLLVLELDHDWFHLRESYYDAICKQRKWDEKIRQAIGLAMSYTELPWEAQLDMIWYVLAAAGAEPPIRVFA